MPECFVGDVPVPVSVSVSVSVLVPVPVPVPVPVSVSSSGDCTAAEGLRGGYLFFHVALLLESLL